MSHVAHLSLQTKPGSFQKVCDRYHQFAEEVLASHPDLHDVIIVVACIPTKNSYFKLVELIC
jgi:hypothetical protein